MRSPAQTSSINWQPEEIQVYSQDSTNKISWEETFDSGLLSHQSEVPSEVSGPSDMVDRRYLYVDPNVLSLNQPAVALMHLLVTNRPATPAPITQPLTPALVHKFQCNICNKSCDRASRVDSCRNRHLGLKPHQCMGSCGTPGWYVARGDQQY